VPAFEHLAPEVVDQALVGGALGVGAGQQLLVAGMRLDRNLRVREKRRAQRDERDEGQAGVLQVNLLGIERDASAR